MLRCASITELQRAGSLNVVKDWKVSIVISGKVLLATGATASIIEPDRIRWLGAKISSLLTLP